MRVRVPAGDAAGTLRRTHFPLTFLVPSLVGLLGIGSPLGAQTPELFYACYVPLTGSVYRIKTADTKPACSSTSHIEFSWTDGVNAVRSGDAAGGDLSSTYPDPRVVGLQGRAVSGTAPTSGQVLTFDGTGWAPATPSGGGGTSDHGSLSGLADDDHPQYLLGNGVRNATDGFAVTGLRFTGGIPASGPGVRLMWYPARAAFRVGEVQATQWDVINVGPWSFATGLSATASGSASTAIGRFTTASGASSIALGDSTIASGHFSTAIGSNATTNNRVGSFVYGDRSTLSSGTDVRPSASNQFVVRAQHFWLGTSSFASNPVGHFLTTSTGAHLTTGGAWTNSSDVALKEGFEALDGEEVLQKVAGLSVREWSYRAEGPGVRHLGPTAQDFHAAFGLGGSDQAIATVDTDGVSLLSIQALEKRTSELAQEDIAQAREIDRLRTENTEQQSLLAELRAELAELRAELKRHR